MPIDTELNGHGTKSKTCGNVRSSHRERMGSRSALFTNFNDSDKCRPQFDR